MGILRKKWLTLDKPLETFSSQTSWLHHVYTNRVYALKFIQLMSIHISCMYKRGNNAFNLERDDMFLSI